jgi:integrase
LRLTAKRIARLRKRIGRYPDGHGLYLQIASAGAASWLFRYEVAGRERMLGLGPLHTVSLKQARERAKAVRLQLLDGVDPIEARKAAKAARALEAAKAVTFREAAEGYLVAHEGRWRSGKHRDQWHTTLATYAYPILGRLPIAAIDTGLVLRALEPIWRTIPETAARVRGRIEKVLDYAAVRNLRAGENPARWKGHLEHILPRRSAIAIKHHAALPYAELPRFMAELRQRDGVAARALEFAILTAARTGEVLHATWDEVKDGIWEIPAGRMKAAKPHRVPLSAQVVVLLKALPRADGNPHVFIGQAPGSPISPSVLRKVLERMDRADITAHGFRSSFADWVSERTSFPDRVREAALAHVGGGKTTRAYARSDLLEERVRLMQAWADFSYGAEAAGEVVPMRKARS